MPEDQPVPLPIGEREIAQEIEAALDYSNRTIAVRRAEMFKSDALSSDAMVRLEQKLDTAIHLLAMLKTKVDSIDAVLARIIHRLA